MEDCKSFRNIVKSIFLIISIGLLLIVMCAILDFTTYLMHFTGGFIFGFREDYIPKPHEYFSLIPFFMIFIFLSIFLLTPEIFGIQKAWKLLKKYNKHKYIDYALIPVCLIIFLYIFHTWRFL